MLSLLRQRYFRTASEDVVAVRPILETKRKERIRRDILIAIAALCIAGFLYFLVIIGSVMLAAWADIQKLDNPGEKLEGFRNFFWGMGFLVASILGLALAAWRSWSNHISTREESRRIRLETFTNAVAQLGHDSPAIRIGAIQSLEQLSQMDRAFYPRVIETLCAFIREHRTIKPEPDEEAEAERVSVDIQLALTVLGRRDRRWEQNGGIIDLHECRLCGAGLSRGTWAGANFYNADLKNINLTGADLKRASLFRADLKGAFLYGTDFGEAHLMQANLRETILEGANFRGADLRGADLRGANLEGANFGGAGLRGADLRGANLGGANFEGAIGLTQEQIQQACQRPNADPPTLPDGLTWHGRICERYQTDEE